MARLLISFLIAAFVLLCTIQALYWPLVMKPGLELAWWQVHWMAQVGYVVGLPVMILARWQSGAILVLASIVWSSLIFWMSQAVFRRLHVARVSGDVA